jgi:pyruvate,water dikinase
MKYKPEMILPELRAEPDAQEFLEHLFRFLAKNGHRALKEIELQSVRWEENPTQILGMIRNYLLADSEPVKSEKKMMQARVELEVKLRRVLEKYPLEGLFRWRWFLLRAVADWTKYLIKLRENSQFYHVMALYIVRKKILQVEAELLRQGKLACEDDIFFLRWEEISRLQTEQFAWGDVEDRIHERRLEHIRLSTMIPPQTLGIDLPKEMLSSEVFSEETIILHGQPVSPGDYEGLARVILDPSVDTELQPGEVLVAPHTDPAWTPLFLTAGAAVVEVGSHLAYAGTIAREYGMPCLVDVAECTKRIQTGDRLKVEGEQGVVRILASETDYS